MEKLNGEKKKKEEKIEMLKKEISKDYQKMYNDNIINIVRSPFPTLDFILFNHYNI